MTAKTGIFAIAITMTDTRRGESLIAETMTLDLPIANAGLTGKPTGRRRVIESRIIEIATGNEMAADVGPPSTSMSVQNHPDQGIGLRTGKMMNVIPEKPLNDAIAIETTERGDLEGIRSTSLAVRMPDPIQENRMDVLEKRGK